MIKVMKVEVEVPVIPKVDTSFFPWFGCFAQCTARKPDVLSVLNWPQRHFIEL